MNKLTFLKVLNSPFKPFKLKWYCGKLAIGTPYFLPRKWVKPTHDRAVEAAMEEIARSEKWNKQNPDSKFKHTIKELDVVYKEMLTRKFSVPKKIGFDFVGLGWKTKWGDTDYRFEWSPLLSFVFFKWQIAITVVAPEYHQYWEAWLYYNYQTKGTQRERIEQCKQGFPLNYKVWGKEGKHSVNYYNLILKGKYK